MGNEVDAVSTEVDAGVDAVRKLADAEAVSKLGPAAGFIVPILDEAFAGLTSLLNREVPALESEIKSILTGLGAKIAGLFHHATIPVDPNSPLARLSNDDLAVMYATLHGTESIQLQQLYAGWTGKSVNENAAGIEWLVRYRGIVK